MNTIRFLILSNTLGKFVLYIIFFVLLVVLSFLPNFSVALIISWLNDLQSAIILTTLDALFIFFLYKIYLRQLKKQNFLRYGKKTINKNIVKVLVITGVSIFLIGHIYSDLFNLDPPKNQQIVEALFNIMPITMTISIIFIAPIAEELLFRGIFFNYFLTENTLISKSLVLLSNALVFGFIHEISLSSIPSLILYSLMGLLLAGSYLYIRDLRYNILIHMINNFIGVLFMIYS